MKSISLVIICSILSICNADIFTNRDTGQIIYGYAVNKTIGSKTVVFTDSNSIEKLSLSQWSIEYSPKGRNNIIAVIPLTQEIISQSQVDAFNSQLDTAAAKGALFVIIEIDSKGSRLDLARQLSSQISALSRFIPIYTFITAHKNGGAINAAIMPALAGNKLFISPNAFIGGENINNQNQSEIKKSIYGNIDFRAKFGDAVGEKFTSGYRAYITSLAQNTKKNPIAAIAMIDEKITLIEIQDQNNPSKSIFIDQVNLKSDDKIIKIWTDEKTLLKLSANQAVQLGIANEVIQKSDDLIMQLCMNNVQKLVLDDHLKIKDDFDKQFNNLENIVNQIQKLSQQLEKSDNRQKRLIKARMIRSFENLLIIAQQNPDFEINPLDIRQTITALKTELAGQR